MIDIAALLFLSATTVSEASMSDQIVQGSVYDQRIAKCGVVVSTGAMASLRPFIETSSQLGGTVRLSVTKRSNSGTSQTSQSWNFSGGTLGSSQVAIDLPASVSLQMSVTDNNGAALCGVEQDLVLNKNGASA